MSTDFGDYSLDDPPVCPNCSNDKEIGIYGGGYYCLKCGYPFMGFLMIRSGQTVLPFQKPQKTIRFNRIINVEGYTVAHNKEYESTNNVVDINSFKPRIKELKEKDIGNPKHGQLMGVLPDDYEECADCKYDHGYDFCSAKRWHDAHPECGSYPTQDDLVDE